MIGFFDGCLLLSILLFIMSWNQQYIYAEGTDAYKFWYCVFELGWWLFFVGLLQYIF